MLRIAEAAEGYTWIWEEASSHEDFLCGDSFNQLKKDSAVALCLMLEIENFFSEKN